MLQTKKINKDLVAVAFSPNEIMLRKSGKAYYGTEKPLVQLLDSKLIIREDIAAEFGIQIGIETKA